LWSGEVAVPLLPDAEPWHHEGGEVGVVCCHGFTGTPSSMRPWAHQLAGAGFSVALPRLPGHGTRWQDLNDTKWPDWYGELERAFDGLREKCRLVFVAGLSMGGTLTIRLAEERGADLAGLVLVNPSLLTQRRGAALLPVISRLVPAFKSIGGDIKKETEHEASYDRTPLRAAASLAQLWKIARTDLGRVTQPVLLYRSRIDHVVEPVNSEILLAGISSGDVTEHVLEDSYHVATLDNDAPAIFAGSISWITEHAELQAGTAAHD
jgi:carboxylesterase